MRSFRLLILILITSFILPPFTLAAETPNNMSVDQLKAEIQKLTEIERDETMSPAVREINRTFLKKRCAELQSRLQKDLAGLRSYLATAASSLDANEMSIVQKAIAQTEKDLRRIDDIYTSSGELVSSSSGVNASSAPTADSSSAGNGIVSGNGNGAGAPLVNIPQASAAPVASSNVATSNSAAGAVPQGRPSTSLNATLNARIRAKVRVDQTDNTKQTETPSISSNTSSLVDQSSASDLIGIGVNLAGLSASSNDNGEEPSSVSVTASAYSLLAAVKRVDPLNPVFYDQNRKWRNFSITLGYDDEDQPDGTKQRAKILGAKFMFINRRDPSLDRNRVYIDTITKRLERTALAFGDLSVRIRGFVFNLEAVRRHLVTPGFKDFLDAKRPRVELNLERERAALAAAAPADRPPIQERIATLVETLQRIDDLLRNPGSEDLFVLGGNALPTDSWTREEREYFVEFQNRYLGTNYREKLDPEVLAALDEFIDHLLVDTELAAFRDLDTATREAVESIRRAPQFSLAFNTKQRRIGIDEYTGTLIFDYGVADRVNLSLNGAYLYNDSNLVGGDLRGFRFAGQLRFQLNRENLMGKKPLFFDVSAQGNWMNNIDAVYKAQGKLTIPIADGIEFPISVTYANHTDLINEKEVRGQFGFTLDTARLVRAFLFR
jgi:hypothetical protein